MLLVGLTGGIGSGKSVVASVFRVLGIPVFDADTAAKEVMESDHDLVHAIKAAFGADAYQEGRLNRKYLADIVFADPFRLEQLNALVHPAAIRAGAQWAAAQRSPYAIKEAALLFEAGSTAGLNYIIGVQAPVSLRIRRVMERSQHTREEVLARMNRQVDDTIKMRLCDHVIVNDEQQMLLPQVLQVHEQLLAKAQQYAG